VTTPVLVSTVYLPSAVVKLVKVHASGLGETALLVAIFWVPQNRMLDGTNETGRSEVLEVVTASVVAESFSHGCSFTTRPCIALPVSSKAWGIGGGTTVGVSVADTIWPRTSATWYRTGVATVPMKVGRGSNVTVPFVPNVYVPSPDTVTDILSQLFGVCTGDTLHRRIVDASAGTEARNVSLASGVKVWLTSHSSLDVSSVAEGGNGMMGVRVLEAV
jgi:hypothetical protein